MHHGASAAVPHVHSTALPFLVFNSGRGRGEITPKKRRAQHQAELKLWKHQAPESW
jgi:hypothetical protein